MLAMGIQVAWDDTDNKLILLTVSGYWTWQDFYTAMDGMYEMMDASPHEVIDFILDMQNGNLFPQNMLSQMQRQASRRHAKSGLMIVVGAAAFARALFSIMERLLPARMKYIKMAESIDKARNLIMQYRADTMHTRTN
jgi:hypothetical protein